MKIPIITIIFIALIAILTYQLKKTTRAQNEVEEQFREKERLANSTRKQDISNLDYITIPAGLFPLNLGTQTENQLVTLLDKQMLNLTGLTNTELKLQYGAANLEILTACDDNFSTMVRLIPDYAGELIANENPDAARNILEFAVQHKADSRAIFDMLSTIYVHSGESGRISDLIAIAESLKSLSKDVIISDLNNKIAQAQEMTNTDDFTAVAEEAKKSKYIVDDDEDDDYSFLF